MRSAGPCKAFGACHCETSVRQYCDACIHACTCSEFHMPPIINACSKPKRHCSGASQISSTGWTQIYLSHLGRHQFIFAEIIYRWSLISVTNLISSKIDQRSSIYDLWIDAATHKKYTLMII